MAKFRKKPVVIEAFQMTRERRGENSEWPNWLNEAWNGEPGEGTVWINPFEPEGEKDERLSDLVIGTMDGVCQCQPKVKCKSQDVHARRNHHRMASIKEKITCGKTGRVLRQNRRGTKASSTNSGRTK